MEFRSLTVGSLKEYLDEFPDDKKIAFTHQGARLVYGIEYIEYTTIRYSVSLGRFESQVDDSSEDAEEVLVLDLTPGL